MGTATSKVPLRSNGEKGRTSGLMASSRRAVKDLLPASVAENAAMRSPVGVCGLDGPDAAISGEKMARQSVVCIGLRSGRACEIATISRVTTATSGAV